MSNLVQSQQTQLSEKTIESIVVHGDLSKLSSLEKAQYYTKLCTSLGLNPASKPFQVIKLQGKEQLYALKGATDQLRQIHGVSIEIVSKNVENGIYVVEAKATDKYGRTDIDLGAVPFAVYNSETGKTQELIGEARANAIMKAITKAKRRVTLSICGLGMLDETEVDSIPNAKTKEPDFLDAELIDEKADFIRAIKPLRESLEWDSNYFIQWLNDNFGVKHPKELELSELKRLIADLQQIVIEQDKADLTGHTFEEKNA